MLSSRATTWNALLQLSRRPWFERLSQRSPTLGLPPGTTPPLPSPWTARSDLFPTLPSPNPSTVGVRRGRPLLRGGEKRTKKMSLATVYCFSTKEDCQSKPFKYTCAYMRRWTANRPGSYLGNRIQTMLHTLSYISYCLLHGKNGSHISRITTPTRFFERSKACRH